MSFSTRSESLQQTTAVKSHSSDPFVANEPIPLPTALAVEANSATPLPNNLAILSPRPQPIGMPILQDNTLSQSHFIEDLGVALKQWLFGVSWERTDVQKSGLISRLRKTKQAIDVDLSCLLFDEHGKVLERVWFKNVRDDAESVRHQGDSLTGTDRGDNVTFEYHYDQEKIALYFDKLPEHIHFIAFVVSSFHGQPLSQLRNGICHISDDEGNMVTQLTLTKLPKNCKAIWLATLSREMASWQFSVNQLPLVSQHLAEFEQQIAQFLQQIQLARYSQPV